jgi:glyoxylase-like metal-dependent hydrolase (beta-lactamase superfamily II)
MKRLALIESKAFAQNILEEINLWKLHDVVGCFDDFEEIGTIIKGLPILGYTEDKVNLTYCHKDPLNFIGDDEYEIKDGNIISLNDEIKVECLETPGYQPSCVCYKIGDYLFTGDSYISGESIVTKLKGGNKKDIIAIKSVDKIKKYFNQNTIICSGHGG